MKALAFDSCSPEIAKFQGAPRVKVNAHVAQNGVGFYSNMVHRCLAIPGRA